MAPTRVEPSIQWFSQITHSRFVHSRWLKSKNVAMYSHLGVYISIYTYRIYIYFVLLYMHVHACHLRRSTGVHNPNTPKRLLNIYQFIVLEMCFSFFLWIWLVWHTWNCDKLWRNPFGQWSPHARLKDQQWWTIAKRCKEQPIMVIILKL